MIGCERFTVMMHPDQQEWLSPIYVSKISRHTHAEYMECV